MADTTPTKETPVQVVDTSQKRQYTKAGSTLLIGLGFALIAFNGAAPQLLVAYPAAKWLPAAIAVCGALQLAIARFQDSGRIAPVNYSDGMTPEHAEPEKEKTDDTTNE